MGTLIWSLAEIWTAPAWSAIQHDGHWKMLAYTASHIFEPVHVSFHEVCGGPDIICGANANVNANANANANANTNVKCISVESLLRHSVCSLCPHWSERSCNSVHRTPKTEQNFAIRMHTPLLPNSDLRLCVGCKFRSCFGLTHNGQLVAGKCSSSERRQYHCLHRQPPPQPRRYELLLVRASLEAVNRQLG